MSPIAPGSSDDILAAAQLVNTEGHKAGQRDTEEADGCRLDLSAAAVVSRVYPLERRTAPPTTNAAAMISRFLMMYWPSIVGAYGIRPA